VPGNIYIPGQCALQILFFCGQTLPGLPYTSGPIEYGNGRKVVGLGGGLPLSSVASGDIAAALVDVTFERIGVITRNISAPGPTTADISVSTTVTGNVNCNISNAPPGTDAICVTAGDWDSNTNAALTVGEGRLFPMGLKVAPTMMGSATINNVTTVNNAGDFANIDFVGAAATLYLDPMTAPAGLGAGVSAIIDRSNTSFNSSGGTLNFNNFFPIRTQARMNRDITQAVLPGGSHPAPHYVVTTISQSVDTPYPVCGGMMDISTDDRTLWTLYSPGALNTVTLPTPPASWPRATNGGLVDSMTTPETDALTYLSLTVHEGLNTSFDYDNRSLDDLNRFGTHVTVNGDTW